MCVFKNTVPSDVPGSLEIHVNGEKENEEHADQRKKKAKTIIISNWTTDDVTYSKTYADIVEIKQRKSSLVAALKRKSAVECFEDFFGEQVLSLIVSESVRYATQNNYHSYELSSGCIKSFIDILLFTGYYALPREKLCWNEDEDFDIRRVRQCMSRKRDLEIKRHHHFNDNTRLNRIPPDERDKLF
ncbi:piggyBac transposable element-derived protein 2-like [Schistocerca americana]|uniref:piggyBac transposable element-derived protein 2-like n=1 Tax=Schistocerca americana TaxID=7009 RepID=UPI001F4FD814|nr:piggyBac transposable element-derived protein 2-like [Schistocerca americana]